MLPTSNLRRVLCRIGLQKRTSRFPGILYTVAGCRLQVAEQNNAWVLDKVKALVTDMTKAESFTDLSLPKSAPNFSRILDEANTVQMIVSNIWMLRVFNKQRIASDFFVRKEWDTLCQCFSAYKSAMKAGKPSDSHKSKLMNLVKALAKKYRTESAVEIEKPHREKLYKRLKLVRDIFPYNIVDLHARASVRSMSKETKGMKNIVQIGLGTQSTYKPRKVDRDSVVLDDKTTPGRPYEKSIVYVPGWSLKADEI